MKTAVVYYSYEGNCDFVAKQIKNHLNADLIRLEIAEERRSGFAEICRTFFQLIKKPVLKPHGFDCSAYDLIILGAPVWVFSPAPAMQKFISEAGISGKKLALFLCHGGGMKKAMEKFKNMLTGNTIVCEIDFKNPAVKNTEEQKKHIEDWAKAFT